MKKIKVIYLAVILLNLSFLSIQDKVYGFAIGPGTCGTACTPNYQMYQPMFSPFMGTPFYPNYMYQPMVGQMNYFNPMNTWSGNWYPTYNNNYYNSPGYYPGSYYGGMNGFGGGLSY